MCKICTIKAKGTLDLCQNKRYIDYAIIIYHAINKYILIKVQNHPCFDVQNPQYIYF